MKATKKVLRAGSERYEFKVFALSRGSHNSPPPIQANLGDPNEPWVLYDRVIADFGRMVGRDYVAVPFTFPTIGHRQYGDFVGSVGQRSLKHTRVVVSDEPLRFTGVMRKVRQFAELAQCLRFPKSDHCACVRGLSMEKGMPTFSFGSGPYEEVFATMNSQGLRFKVSAKQLQVAKILSGPKGRNDLAGLSSDLVGKFGDVTIRQATHRHFGGIPPFDSGAVSYLIGMAAVITTSDGYAVFGRRAKRKVSFNTGINLATSGGFVFDREKIETSGFAGFVEHEILREAREEVGIRGKDCAVTILSLLRELSRAGSPEILALIEFFGTLKDFTRGVVGNNHPEQDIDAIFAIPIQDARRLVLNPEARKVLQPKALAALIMLDRHLRMNGS